ncbi:MAG: hypothetical protein JNK29_01625, partial [Anaerolineales bacterium]|nr:hypothetical protein [Anaerolineales bacterium]
MRPPTLDSNDLSQAGWGVIFAAGADPVLRQALEPLLEWRRHEAGGLYREFEYRPGESKNAFLARYGAGPGPVDPERVPYFLLLVGGPDQIPFAFQQRLGLGRAVGRLDFDQPADYARYAASALAAGEEWQPQQAVVFGPQHPNDPPTAWLSDGFLAPLAARLAQPGGWEVELITGEAAGKERLQGLLAEGAQPALMLLAGHGLALPADDPRQPDLQGALVCQDWPGPSAAGALRPEWYFTAADVPPPADLSGTIWVQFSSFSAGTLGPEAGLPDPADAAARGQRAFSAPLARRLLALPAGGALAVVGWVGPAWLAPAAEAMSATRLSVYSDCLDRLARGERVGAAFAPVQLRYAELALDLSAELEEIQFGKTADPERLADLWMARNDAGRLAVMGDPAARLITARAEPQYVQKGAPFKKGSLWTNLVQQAANLVQKAPDQPRGAAPAAEQGEPLRLEAGLKARLARLPAALWPDLTADQHPLASLWLENSSYERTARVRVLANLEALSETQEALAEIEPLGRATIDLLPPPAAKALADLRRAGRASLKVRVEAQADGALVWETTRSVWLLEPGHFPLGVRDPSTGEWQDFSLYLARFISPEAAAVQRLLAAAARLHPEGQLAGVDGPVGPQVQALLQAVRQAGLKPGGDINLRRTADSVLVPAPRPPAEVLASGAADSLEFALLMAGLLHAAGLNAVVFISEAFTGPGWTDEEGGYLQLHHLAAEDFEGLTRTAAETVRTV